MSKIQFDIINYMNVSYLSELSLLYGRIELFDGEDRKQELQILFRVPALYTIFEDTSMYVPGFPIPVNV
jgi:hypothetical protein